MDQIVENRRGNYKVKRKGLIKLEFYSLLEEDRMPCIDAIAYGHGYFVLATNET